MAAEALGRIPGKPGAVSDDHRILPRWAGSGGRGEWVMEALLERLRSEQARLFEYGGANAVRDFGDSATEYRAARETASLFPLTWRGALRFVGPDRRAWLHGQVTNDVNGLADGRWNEAAMLSIQGRMLAWMRLFAVPGALLADLPAEIVAATAETLDRYLIMEKVE